MENPEEILHSLEEFSKTKPKDIPRELEEYLCFVAKTGDPVYQWSAVKSLFREKMLTVITDFYETCPSVEIPPCPNVDLFNYDVMKTFILEKLDTFAAAPFTLQRISELLTTPRKEYNRIDKYMRALEKNILVVSTTEPGGRRTAENGEGIMNGLESEHLPESSNSSNDINVEEMDDAPSWPRLLQNETEQAEPSASQTEAQVQETEVTGSKVVEGACTSSQDTVITCRGSDEPYVSIEPVPSNTCTRQENSEETDVSVTITAIPAGVQKRRNSVEPVVSSESAEEITESGDNSTGTADSPKDSEPKLEETSSSSQQIEDADSSSKESIDDKTPDTSSEVENPPTEETSPRKDPPNEEENETNNEVETSQKSEDTPIEESTTIEEEATVDTTKCSNSSPPPISQGEEKLENLELEITSSEKIDDHSLDSEAEAKQEETGNEANSLSENDDKEEVHLAKTEEVDDGEKEVATTTPMEVDEECSNSEKVEEVVKAEATSDSPL